MSDAEEKELIDLAASWRHKTCRTGPIDPASELYADCGDTDCMAYRQAASDLMSLLNTQRLRRM